MAPIPLLLDPNASGMDVFAPGILPPNLFPTPPSALAPLMPEVGFQRASVAPPWMLALAATIAVAWVIWPLTKPRRG